MSEITHRNENFDLTDLFTKAFLNRYGIIILGEPVTTWYGKTQFALRLALEWCKNFHEATGCPKEDCCVAFTNTIDVARELNFKRSYCWICDEMVPADGTQTIYASENMLKVFLTPMAPGSLRSRNADMVLPVGMPRIIPANAENAEEWCGFRCKWSAPLQRKSIVFSIDKPLCDEAWRKGDIGQDKQHDDEGDEVARTP